ncbi:hypothetical protein [Xanthomonas phage JGB6]|nr:hypothetical protein [Xanthomonas phage JGB6]
MYYVTPEQLESGANYACSMSRTAAYAHAKIKTQPGSNYIAAKRDRNKKILVTLDLLTAIDRDTGISTWFNRNARNIDVNYFASPRTIMNHLYNRAVAEGLVSNKPKK